jgi:transcriptional regulator GlxA family with amidase domain
MFRAFLAMPDFVVLVLRGAYGASVAVTLDMLGAAAKLAPRLKLPRPTWQVVSPDGGSVALSSGLQVQTHRLGQHRRAGATTWVVPGLGVDEPEALQARLARDDAQRASALLGRHIRNGGAVAASCSAVFLLGACGALAGRRATTSWWLAPLLQRMSPDCAVDADPMVCADGPVCTAGAALAQADLMLHLLRSRFGIALADMLGRLLLIDGRQAQASFAVPSMQSHGSDLVRQLTRHIESALPATPSVPALADAVAMSPRTLARHVRAATGKSPLALVQSVRLHRARALIENTRMSIEQVAAQVGYQDATALRRLMRKAAGATPSRFRVGSFTA